MTAAALLTSAWSHWTSPASVLDRVHSLAPIDLDPCGNESDQVRAAESWWGLKHPGRHGHDGLREPWVRAGRGLIYANPPYGREVPDWVAKAARENADARAEIVMLIPTRSDTAWWHEHVVPTCAARCFWKGRLRFGNAPDGKGTTSTFPSTLIYWGPRPFAFGAAFEDAGEIVIG